jgi:regulator of protease activity HflC (stomatin/prohibitin superfamily)
MFKRILVGDNERVLLSKNGRFKAILKPGAYRVFGLPWTLQTEVFRPAALAFTSPWADFLLKKRPDVVEANFVVVETGDDEVALIYAEGKLVKVLGPGRRALFWKDPVAVSFELASVKAAPEAPRGKLEALARLGADSLVTFAAVDEGKTGLLFLDNKLVRALAPGAYGFWNAAGNPRVETVDLRLQTLEIPGQEILTRDKVSIRVNVAADYRMTDPLKARQSVKDATAYLYRTLQLAIRQSLGKKTLEEILADKVDVEPAVAAEVRRGMAEAGISVGTIALRDIVLPGEVRDILNQVVTAEKQAQANLIRRREETAATRSLLNTAKLLEDNPILVRLKELETLEKLSEKVERISVTGGFDGLLTELLTPRGEKR